jgi:hypothetical protein
VIKACLPLPPIKKDTGYLEAVIGVADKWPDGHTLRVYFFPSVSRTMRKRCLERMREWSQYANIKFAETDNIDESDIRVTFEKGGSWSYLGTQAKLLPKKPTMNFGWLTESTDDKEFNRVVLHETGHALGLKHEHQHPTNDIPWDRDAAIKYYGRQGWTAEMVEQQVLARTDPQGTQFTEYDPNSIMEYPIPKELVTDPRYAVGWNTALSATDKKFIGEQYPFSGQSAGGRRRRHSGSTSSSSSESGDDYSDEDDYGYDDDADFDDDYDD